MTKCQNNCGSPSVKIYFTLVEQGMMAPERTHLESPDFYVTKEGFINLTKEVRMFVSILENPDIQFILQVKEADNKLCDVCFKGRIDERQGASL